LFHINNYLVLLTSVSTSSSAIILYIVLNPVIMHVSDTRSSCRSLSTLLTLTLLSTTTLAKAIEPLPYYTVGDAIPISCLNRTIETGEHIVNDQGELQYIPFPKCNETGRPLELNFGIEKGIYSSVSLTRTPPYPWPEQHVLHKL